MNKVKFGLSNVHIYPIQSDESTGTKYAEGMAVPGAVSLSLKAEGTTESFHADNIAYFVSSSNNGYSGDLEMALLPDEFITKILGAKKDEQSGVLIETADDKNTAFALAFQFEGDENGIRHIMYKCTATRPSIEGSTKTEKTDPKTEKFTFTATARVFDKRIKAKCEKDSTAYDKFFEKPYEAATV